MTMKPIILTGLSGAALLVAGGLALAAGQYGPGVSDTEIKIGNTMPYSGPASAYAVIGKAEAAYFAMINDQGGVNGRKINFISRDDGYSPPKTVEVVRKLVEQDQVLLVFNSLGTAPNLAIREYLNDNKVPHLFVASGAETWNDPTHFPWSMGFGPSYRLEGRIYGRYILKNMPDAKIGVLYQNDDRRSREYLTEREVERLIEAAKQNRCGHRDATAILVAYRHGLRAAVSVRRVLESSESVVIQEWWP
jgi:branched-chain amino acid transport system substrate-binding protein